MQFPLTTGGGHILAKILKPALLVIVLINVALCFNRATDNQILTIDSFVGDALYMCSLVLLLGVVFYHYIQQQIMTRQAEKDKQQLGALISMFTGVKHMLNNDMQVVLGNAELAALMIKTEEDARKPVKNITLAANDAIERIEQLSAFNSTGVAAWKPIDLNATLRETMDKLALEFPPIVTLKMELGHLSTRVIADKYLLGLSLSHLVRIALASMRHGGEIVVKTEEEFALGTAVPVRSVRAEIFIVRALSHSGSESSKSGLARHNAIADVFQLEQGLSTTKALVERSGAQSVRLTAMTDESLIRMAFGSSEKRLNFPVQSAPAGELPVS
jgi:hypothetical protein